MKKRILPLLLALLLLFLSSCNHAGIGTVLQAGSETGEENAVTTGTQEPSETTDTQGTLLETDTQTANETDSSTSVETSTLPADGVGKKVDLSDLPTNYSLLELRNNPPEIFYDVDETYDKSKSDLAKAYLSLQNGKTGADYSDEELLKQLSAALLFAENRAVFQNLYVDFQAMVLPNDQIAALVEKTSGQEGKDSLLYYIEKTKLFYETRALLPSKIVWGSEAVAFSFDSVKIKENIATVKAKMHYTFQYNDSDTCSGSAGEYELKFSKSNGIWYTVLLTSNDTLDQGFHFKPFDYEAEYAAAVNQSKIEEEAKKNQETQKADIEIIPYVTTNDYTVMPNNVKNYSANFYSQYNTPRFADYNSSGGDCMNFASQCLWAGLGGSNDQAAISNADRPMDNSGSYLWKRDFSSFISCGNFRSYLANNTAETGLYGQTLELKGSTLNDFSSISVGTIIHGLSGSDPYGHACIVIDVGSRTRDTIKIGAHNKDYNDITLKALFGSTAPLMINNISYYKTVSSCNHTYSTISPSTDGEDGTCNLCGYERMRIRANNLGPCAKNTSQTISGFSTTICYQMSASITTEGGAVTWLATVSNASSYSKTYVFPSAGLYKVTIYGRDLNPNVYPSSINRSCSYYVRVA